MSRTTAKVDAGRILVVDDQENMCWVLSKLLSERGHVVGSAQSGARALRMIESLDYQVAVVDYRLPDSDGITLSLQLRVRLPRLSSILMTSYGGSALCNKALDQHLFAYLDKPFNNDLMIATIESGLQAWEAAGDGGARPRTLFPGRAHARM